MRSMTLAVGICLCMAAAATAEDRSAVISLRQSSDKTVAVSIGSEESTVIRKDVSLEEARSVIGKMAGKGKTVQIVVVAESAACMPAVQDILKDISANPQLSLS